MIYLSICVVVINLNKQDLYEGCAPGGLLSNDRNRADRGNYDDILHIN